jgi:hypothetical protein
MTVLAVTHELARDRCVATQRPAQLADDPLFASVIQMDVLARQRCAPAVGAAVAIGLQRTDPAAQQEALELLYMGDRQRHGHSDFAVAVRAPSGLPRSRAG